MAENKKKIEKGCKRKLKTGEYEMNRFCSDKDLCPICEAELKGFKSGTQSKEKEMLDEQIKWLENIKIILEKKYYQGEEPYELIKERLSKLKEKNVKTK